MKEETKLVTNHFITSFNESLMYRLFTYFDIHDLSSFACTCKQFNNRVTTYYELKCKEKNIAERLVTLIDTKTVLKSEAFVRKKINDGNFTAKWLYTTWKTFRKVYRESVHKLWIPEIRNLSYITYDYKNIHCFQDIEKGSYKLALRLKMDPMMFEKTPTKKQNKNKDTKPEMKWDTWKKLKDCPLTLIIRFVHREHTDIQQKTGLNAVEITLNTEICENLNDSFVSGNDLNSTDFTVENLNPRNGWFDLVMREFCVCELVDVVFEFKDVEARWLSSGLVWDFAELIPYP